MYPGHLRRQLAARGGGLCSVDLGDRPGEDIDLEGLSVEVTGYMSDGDVLSKNITRTDDVSSGYVEFKCLISFPPAGMGSYNLKTHHCIGWFG